MDLPSFTRKQLYDLVWKEPIQTLAPKFGLSDRGLAKLCERHGIPTPPRGYWARKQAGHKVAKAPLIELEGARQAHVIARYAPSKSPAAPGATAAPDPLLVFWQTQRAEIGDIKVAKTLTSPHPVIAQWLKEDDDHRAVRARWGSSFSVAHPTPLERRRLRILSALYKALESRGVAVHCARGARIVELRHQRDAASFDLWEYVQQKRRVLTDAERTDHWNADAKYRVEQIPTKMLRGKVPAYLPARVPTTWTETEDTPFEGMLGEVAATVFTALAHAKAQREEREEAERRRWEAQQAAQRREEAAKREAARRQRLRDRAQHWREAQDLRAYVAAVEAAAARGQVAIAPADLAAWRAWALGCARDLDPLASGAAAKLETAGEQG